LPVREERSRLEGAGFRRLLGGWLLLVLCLHSACVAGGRGGGPVGRGGRTGEPGAESARVYALEWMELGAVATRPVPITQADFKRAIQRLARDVRPTGSPREAALEWLAVPGTSRQDVETVAMAGVWLLEGYRERTYSFVPLAQSGPVRLTPEADEALRARYLAWCGHRGGGDCLGLLEDGPYLRTDDRRTLALALAFGSVLDETREALANELLDTRALVSLVVWSVALYCMMWLVPEPTMKAVAASLTVMLVAWLGWDTVYGLMDGWSHMANAAHEASTFEELRAAGSDFGKVLGQDAARAMILAVATLTGHSLGKVAAKVRSLPGYGLAQAQWEAQGGAAVLEEVRQVGTVVAGEGALAAAVEVVETVAASPQGPLAVAMLKKGRGGGSGQSPGGRSPATVLRHRGGNRQVELGNGQRWHLPRGKSVGDIPAQDKVGDQLQEAVTRAAREWGPDKLSDNEAGAIKDALDKGRYWLARLLEREARGRYVHETVKRQFQRLYRFNQQGVDVVDLSPGGYQYEILSGSESNLARHGRRMAGEFFRMLTF